MKATLKLDSGMLSNVTKKIYLHEATLKIKYEIRLTGSQKYISTERHHSDNYLAK